MKYLSSSKLLKLQLQDAGLRRHFLLQVLIFLHAVRHVGKLPVKAAAPALKDRQARAHIRCLSCSGSHTVTTISGLRVYDIVGGSDVWKLMFGGNIWPGRGGRCG